MVQAVCWRPVEFVLQNFPQSGFADSIHHSLTRSTLLRTSCKVSPWSETWLLPFGKTVGDGLFFPQAEGTSGLVWNARGHCCSVPRPLIQQELQNRGSQIVSFSSTDSECFPKAFHHQLFTNPVYGSYRRRIHFNSFFFPFFSLLTIHGTVQKSMFLKSINVNTRTGTCVHTWQTPHDLLEIFRLSVPGLLI